jgi:FtsP/CotA-like multicopper oxidase with cupredoxin domain
VDEFRIAVAETFDVIVEPSGQEAFTIFAQSMDRTGYAAGTLAVREGLRAPVPSVDPRPRLTMDDMGHGDGADTATWHPPGRRSPRPDPHAGHDMPGRNRRPPDPHAGHAMPGQKPPPQPDPHAGHDMPAMTMQTHPGEREGNPLVDMQTMMPTSRLDDPGIGLRDNGRHVLTYGQLRSSSTIRTAASRRGRSSCT